MRVDSVTRDDTIVIYAAASGDWENIPQAASQAFERLEAAIPPRGRRMFGYWQPTAREYRACYALEDGDGPETIGLMRGVIPGGHYRRARLKGSDAFSRIPEAFVRLEEEGAIAHDGRPWFEFYRRHDEVEVFVPILSGRAR